MRKDIPLHQYPKDVQIATHMIGLNYKRPYIRHGRRYYKPYRTASSRPRRSPRLVQNAPRRPLSAPTSSSRA